MNIIGCIDFVLTKHSFMILFGGYVSNSNLRLEMMNIVFVLAVFIPFVSKNIRQHLLVEFHFCWFFILKIKKVLPSKQDSSMYISHYDSMGGQDRISMIVKMHRNKNTLLCNHTHAPYICAYTCANTRLHFYWKRQKI